jgi:hypothetical protein
LKTGPQINISKSLFSKIPGTISRYCLCCNLGEIGNNEKKYNNFGGLSSCQAFWEVTTQSKYGNQGFNNSWF